MAVSKLMAVSCRRNVCLGIVVAIGLLSRANMSGSSQLAIPVAKPCTYHIVPTPCSERGDDTPVSQSLLKAWRNDEQFTRAFKPALYNITCSLYEGPNGYCTCVMDDQDLEITKSVPCVRVDESYEKGTSALGRKNTDTVSLDSQMPLGEQLVASFYDAPKQGWLMVEDSQSDGATVDSFKTQPRAHRFGQTWATVQSMSQRLRQVPAWRMSVQSDSASFSLLRLRYQKSLLSHLDTIGAFCHRKSRQLYTPTLSVSMLLPQKSVWSFAKRDKRYVQPSPAEFTALPKKILDSAKLQDVNLEPATANEDEPLDKMAKQMAYWAMVARDFNRQNTMPGLRSGNTVIDERNFSMS